MFEAKDAEHMPADWTSVALGEVASCTLGGTPSTEIPQFWGGSIPWMASGDVHLRRIDDVPGRITAAGLASSNATLVSPPAVAIGLAGQGKTRGTVALTLCELATNQSIALVRGDPSQLQTEYLFHALDRRYEELRARSSGGGRGGLSKGILDSVPIDLPPLAEQEVITAVLDTLDTTIRQTEAIIAKLKQVKQGLLHDLLTRGIDANGELRPPQSEAPPTWRIELMGTLMDGAPRNGIYKPASDIGEGALLIGQTAFTSLGSVDASLARRARLTRAEQEMFGLRREDLLVSRVFATREGVGQPVLVPEFGEPAVFESNMMRVRCNADLVRAPYLFYWLKHRASRAWLMSRAFASNQASINRETLCGVLVHLPPVYEQDQIMSMISAEDARLEREVDQLMKLKQLKSGLMDDLLTGRVRVTPLLQSQAV